MEDCCKDSININWVKKLPKELCSNAIYFVKAGIDIKMYVTNYQGVPFLIGESSGGGDAIITSPDESITIVQDGQNFEISVSQQLQAMINLALQQGDNISLLNNDAGYITAVDIPPFNPNNYDLDDFNNVSVDPFVRQSEINNVTNLSYTPSAINGIVNSDTGTDATIPLASTVNAGLFSPSEKIKLSDQSGVNTGDNAINTTSNIYADAKVANNLTPSTTVAPSKTAVNGALALKEDLIDYLQQPLFNFNFNTNVVGATGFTNATINGGTVVLQSDSIMPLTLRTSRSSDIAECWLVRGSAGSANSGHSVGISSQNPFYVGSTLLLVLEPTRITDVVGRYGLVFTNGFSPLTSIAGNNAICVEVVNNQLTFKTSVASTGVSIAPSYTLTTPQWLYIVIEAESATTIRCKIRTGLTGTLVYNELITSLLNIPLSNNLTWNQLRISLNVVTTIASADYITQYGKIATYAKKPNFLKYF